MVVEHQRVEARAVEGELRPRRVPGVPLAGLGTASLGHLCGSGKVAVHGLLRRCELGRRRSHPARRTTRRCPSDSFSSGVSCGHDGRLTPAAC